MNWRAFVAAAPELGAFAEQRLAANRLVLVGTLRGDGAPRISPVEAFVVRDDLMLGMMWQSKKALDLVRDPRLVVHSATTDPAGTEGDLKLYGWALDVSDPALRSAYGDVLEERIQWRPPEPFHLFALAVESAGFVRFGPEPVALRWSPDDGERRLRHPDE
jgi:Pyridoxamine 5'-phosphate oxidase